MTISPSDLTTLQIIIDGTGTAFTQGQEYSYRVGQAFTSPGVPTDLTFVQLVGPSFQGQFTAIGFQADTFSLTGDANGFLYVGFTPVPEPTTILGIAALSLGGLSAVRRRFRKTA